MKTKIYLGDWFYNAGMIGFLKIVQNAKDNFITVRNNYIEFDTENLRNFHKLYFQYFKDQYNIVEKMQKRMDTSYFRIKGYLESAEEKKVVNDKVKKEKGYVKSAIKTQLNKIKKIDEETYQQMLEKYNEIDTIKEKEQIETLKEIFDFLLVKLSQEHINNRLTMNFFKSILSSNYFGQISFLHVSKSSFSFEEQENLMYKDYISNLVEIGFLQDILEGKYTTEQIKQYLQREDLILTAEMEKIYKTIDKKYIQKEKSLEEIQEYIKQDVYTCCQLCENETIAINQYSESNFIPLAVSTDNITNFFWNQNVKFPLCDLCKLILFCIPASITTITKTAKENKNGMMTYVEKEVYSFVNYDTSIEKLLQTNYSFSLDSKRTVNTEHPYQLLIMDIIQQNQKISKWELDNIFVVEFESEYGAFSRLEYFNIKKYMLQFFTEYAQSSLVKIKDYRYKLQIVDAILKNKNMTLFINDNLREQLAQGNRSFGFSNFIATGINIIIGILKKGGDNVKDTIQKSNNRLHVLYNIGIQIKENLKIKGEENKLDSYTYKMLNCIKSGNRKEFTNIAIKLLMSMEKDVPEMLVTNDENVDWQSMGHSLIAGLVSNRYEKQEKGGNENE